MARKVIKPVFSRPREIKSLIPGRLARSPLSLYSKSAKRKLCVCAWRTLASAVQGWYRQSVAVTEMISSIFFNSQIAQVNTAL